ncbi:MAG: hypothetical protein RL685_5135 [Pseudomonadota bacterium]
MLVVVATHSPAQLNLFEALLSGLVGGSPVPGNELGQATHRPARVELADDIEQVLVGVDAEQGAVVDEGVGGGEPLAAACGAGEEVVVATDGEVADPSLDATVVDLEAPVLEAAPKEHTLVDRVGGSAAQRGLRQEFGVKVVNPVVERVEQRQRAPPALLRAG